MRDRHWTDEELLLRLFDVEPADEHLQSCGDCSHRWEKMKHNYENRPAISGIGQEGRLAVQRSNIHARLENKTERHPILLSASFGVLAVILIASVLVFRQSPPKPIVPVTMSENEIFEDIYRTAFDLEPEAIVPAQSLFEEAQ